MSCNSLSKDENIDNYMKHPFHDGVFIPKDHIVITENRLEDDPIFNRNKFVLDLSPISYDEIINIINKRHIYFAYKPKISDDIIEKLKERKYVITIDHNNMYRIRLPAYVVK